MTGVQTCALPIWERWPAEVLSDTRVVHLWDEEASLGRWYSHHVSDGKHIVWDTFLLYPAGAPLAAPPESLLAIGATIIGKRPGEFVALPRCAQEYSGD